MSGSKKRRLFATILLGTFLSLGASLLLHFFSDEHKLHIADRYSFHQTGMDSVYPISSDCVIEIFAQMSCKEVTIYYDFTPNAFFRILQTSFPVWHEVCIALSCISLRAPPALWVV